MEPDELRAQRQAWRRATAAAAVCAALLAMITTLAAVTGGPDRGDATARTHHTSHALMLAATSTDVAATVPRTDHHPIPAAPAAGTGALAGAVHPGSSSTIVSVRTAQTPPARGPPVEALA